MWYLIITARSLIWMLLSLFSTLLMLSAFLSPSWLVGPLAIVTVGNDTFKFNPSVGVYAICTKNNGPDYPVCRPLAVSGLATASYLFPGAWKAATVFLTLGLSIMCLTVCMGLFSCCFQSIFKKSVFTISGAAQAVAGICYIIGVMLYPMGWGTDRVQKLCGRDASSFYMDYCSIGAGLWVAVTGTLLTFLCACLSVPAEKSTSSDKVQDKIYEGQTLICLT